jgi:hypothetical protein
MGLSTEAGDLSNFAASDPVLGTNSGHFRRSGEGATVYGARIDQTPLAFLGAMQHIGFVAG